ncbi:uncharacterized protein LOC116263564 [Nymphaea colorata]|uniref:Calmodulin-binding domain-containing protein n=1 Tax=Nymphaea colorata TaxID=210225 RepID=A0A5K0XV84_9MAGN|nr:uncharacterized protein LOC116263564 [Nymphaea colorata]
MAARVKDVAAARKGDAASASASSPSGKARSNPEPTSQSGTVDSELVDPITGKPLPHYLRPTISSCHDICKYGKRRAAAERREQEKTIRRLPSIKSVSTSPSSKPSAAAHRRSSSTSTSPKDSTGKAVATPFTRTVSFGRTTTPRTSRPRERQPISAISIVTTNVTATTTTTKKQETAKPNKNANSSSSDSTVANTVTKVSESSRDHEVEKIEEKTMILEECDGSQEEKLEHAVPLEALGSIPSSEEESTPAAVITITTADDATFIISPSMDEPETAEQKVAMPTEEQTEEPEICTIGILTPQLSVQEGLPGIDELQDEDVGESAINNQVDDDADAEENAAGAKNVDDVGEIQGEEKEENVEDQKDGEEEKEKKQEEEEIEEKEENDSSYDEYSDNLDSENDDDSEEEGEEELKDGKQATKREKTPRGQGEEGQEDTPKKLRFRRGTVLSRGAEECEDKPKKLRFRRGRVIDEEDSKAHSRRRRFKQRGEAMDMDGAANVTTAGSGKAVLKANGGQEKKDGAVVFNQVIEETASKLVESRKSKVRALVGAFETVISIHETDAQNSQGHAHAHPAASAKEEEISHGQ